MRIPLSAPDVVLRPVTALDAADLRECCDDPVLARDLGGSFPHPYTLAHADQFVERAGKPAGPFLHLAITRSDRVAGMVGFAAAPLATHVTAELGYWVTAAARGQGLATLAVRAFRTYAFETFPELQRLEAIAFDYNVASQRVLEKAGFEREATLKARSRTRDGLLVNDVIFAAWRDEPRLR